MLVKKHWYCAHACGSAKTCDQQSSHKEQRQGFYIVQQNHLRPRQEGNNSHLDFIQSLGLQIT